MVILPSGIAAKQRQGIGLARNNIQVHFYRETRLTLMRSEQNEPGAHCTAVPPLLGGKFIRQMAYLVFTLTHYLWPYERNESYCCQLIHC